MSSSSAQSVPVRFSFESKADMDAYIRDALGQQGVSVYYDEVESVPVAHSGYKKRYEKFDTAVGEGIPVQNMFIAIHFSTLMQNYAFEKKKNPLFPPNYNTKLPSVYGKGYEKVTVSDEFFRYAIKEYENHQRKRIWEGEERSNCFKKGAHKDWTKADRDSVLINAVKLPPKPDISYRQSLGSN